MDIWWMGHSALRLRSGDVTLITDPYDGSVGLSMTPGSADIVTVSHDHPHHSNREAVEGDPRILEGPGEYEVASFYIAGFGTRRSTEGGEREVNTVFTMRAEDLTLCHLGDLNQVLSPAQVQRVSPIDVLFVPAGGTCTIDAATAAELVSLIRPRIVVPIHYRMEGLSSELEPLDAFLAALGVSDVSTQPRLSVTPSNLPSELRVVVLRLTT